MFPLFHRKSAPGKPKGRPKIGHPHLHDIKGGSKKKELDIEQGVPTSALHGRVGSKDNTYRAEPPTPSRVAPPPPPPGSLGFANLAYQVEAPGDPDAPEDDDAHRVSSDEYQCIDDFDDDDKYISAIQEDEYVNVGSRIRNKYEEIKGRLSALAAPRDAYENAEAINQYRQNYLDKHPDK